jgi:hypothetical protein
MTDWRIAGEELVSCNCDWGCPCQFNALPTTGNCEALVAFQIRDGHFGDTPMDGVTFAEVLYWPGAIHEGDGTRQLVIDSNASDEQRAAVETLVSGSEGGTYFEIFASVLPHDRDPITAPIEFTVDRERREASVRVGDVAHTQVQPIKNPVSGEEHRVRIDIPDGFEYHQAEMGNTVELRTSADAPLSLSMDNTYAQLNEFDFSNA